MREIKHLISIIIPAFIILISACGDKKEDIQLSIQRHMERSIAYEEQGQYKAAIIEARGIIQLDRTKISGYQRLAELFMELGNAKEASNLLLPLKKEFTSSTYLLLVKALNDQGKFFSANIFLNGYINGGGDPINTDYRTALAVTLAGNKKLEKSFNILESLIQKNPENIKARNTLSTIYLDNNFYLEGNKLISETLKKFPENPRTLYLASLITYTDGNLDSAEDLLSQSLMNLRDTDILTPLRLLVLDQLATVLTERKRIFEAVTYRKILTQSSPEASKAKSKFNSALKLLNSGDTAGAEALFSELYKDHPNLDINALYLGMINYQKGDLESANKLFNTHLDTEIAPELLIEQAALSNLKLNQTAEAIILLEKALLIHPNNASLLRFYGLAALQDPTTEKEGLLALHKSLALKPEQNTLRLTLASHYINKEAQEQGFAQIGLILKNEPGHIKATALYAQTMEQNGRTEEASQAINKLLTLKKNDAEALNLAARYALIKSDAKKSENLYLKTIELEPDNLDALNSLAAIAFKNRQYEKSAAYFEKIIILTPGSPHPYKGLVVALETGNQPNKALERLLSYTLETSTDEQRYTASAVTAEYYLRNGDLNTADTYIGVATSAGKQSQYVSNISSLLDYTNAERALQNKDWDTARSLFIKSSNGNIPQQRILSSLIQVELKAGQPEEVDRLIYILEDQYPNEITTVLARTSILDAKGKQKTANTILELKWENKITPLLGNVIYDRLQGEPVEQSRFLSRWHNAEPNNYKPLTYLALKAQQHNDTPAAIAYYEKALKLKENSPSLLNNLAWLYYEAKNPLAQETARRAYELAPSNAAILDTYGWILATNGHKNESVKILQEALKVATPSELKEIEAHLEAVRKI